MGAAVAASAGASALNAYSQIQAGNQAVKAANRQQRYLNNQARQTITQGDFEADLIAEQGDQVAASQRTGFAGNGIVVGEGSAGRIEQETRDIAAADAAQMRRNAFNQAMGIVEQGNEGVRAAKVSAKNSRLNAIGSLLSGGSQAYSIYRG